MSWLEPAIRWYATLVLLTWAFAPGVRWLCCRLPDHGVTLARPLAMLAAVYPAWLLASLGLIQFQAPVIWASVAIAAGAGWVFARRQFGNLRSWMRGLLSAEIASAVMFAGYVWLRGFTPQILGTEKPMDIAFLASSMRATVMPPPDPWFAGEPINYYYLGYLLHGTIGRLTGTPPETGFNLALATMFSTAVVASFGVAWNVIVPWAARGLAIACSAFAAFGLVFAGNLYAPMRIIQDAPAAVSAWWWAEEGIGWRASRIVCDGPRAGFTCLPPATETINEFPYFSFLLGDLHPHLMALPYSIVAIGLCWNAWQFDAHAMRGDRVSSLMRIAMSGAVVGALYPLNAWDFPTFFALMAVAAWVASRGAARSVTISLLTLAGAALVPWIPFFSTYVPPAADSTSVGITELPGVATVLSAFSLHVGERTSFSEYLTIFGAPYIFGVALVISTWRTETPPGITIKPTTVAIVVAATVVPSVIMSAPLLALCGIPLALALIWLGNSPWQSPQAFALVLLVFAWTLSIGAEFVYIRDAFDDRMNTLFKFYFQVWTLYAIAAAIALGTVWQAARLAWQRSLVVAVATASVLAGMVYPAVASFQWTDRYAAWQGLDGLAYAEETSIGEVAAIRWLRDHAEPGDILLEAAGCSYFPFDRLPYNRVSAFTGIPTVIGWENHERQWRAGQPGLIADIPVRQADVAAIFADPSGALAEKYGVRWLFVGDYEAGSWSTACNVAGPYGDIASPSFPGSAWAEAFSSGDVRVFRRVLP